MKPATCVHFRGVQHQTCAAGVTMLDVRQEQRDGPHLWPCLPGFGSSRGKPLPPCERRVYPTPAEIAADEAETVAALDAVFAGRSPCCNASLDRQSSPRTTVSHCSQCGAFVARECRRIGES